MEMLTGSSVRKLQIHCFAYCSKSNVKLLIYLSVIVTVIKVTHLLELRKS